MLVLPRKRFVIQLFESQNFYDLVCGDLRTHNAIHEHELMDHNSAVQSGNLCE